MSLWRVAIWIRVGLALPTLADPPARSTKPVPQPEAHPGHRDAPAFATAVAPEAVNAAITLALFSPAGAEPVPETEPEAGQHRGLLALLGGQARRNQRGLTAVRRSLRPLFRPAMAAQLASVPAHAEPPAQTTASGGLCGVPGITGERLARIPGRLNGCGIAEPARIRASNGITFSQRPTLNCQAARALQGWLTEDVVPEIGRRGGGVASVRVLSSYSCRTRNNQPGARLSEHATGNAIDIAGFGLANGREITVLSDWGSGAEGRILRNLHAAACGRFGTVLGPNADRYHQDNFHADAVSYRGRAYCR